jgi:hypothetical protein
MIEIPPIPQELFTKFSDLKYFDEPHKYYLGEDELISVTTLIHQYQEEFDENYWSEYKANEFGITREEVLRAWRFINKKGTMKGSIIHDYAENLLLNKIFKYPKEEILKEFGFDPILEEYEITKKHVDKFCADSKGKLIPVKTELVMYDKESLIAGMADLIFYNARAKEFQIWDYKTNKEFSMSSERKLLDLLYLLDDCDLEIYSLQLGLYKAILERNTGIKFGKSYLVWVSHNNDSYEIIETKNRQFYIDQMLQKRIQDIAA